METPHAAFDNDKYIALQSAAIRERAERFGNKLYLEIGGKLLKDLHAARVLPGFEPDVKLRMLQTLGDQIEFIVCAYAGDIEHQRYRADFGTTYDAEVLRLVEDVRARGLAVRSVVLTRFDPSMTAAAAFADRLRREGLAVYLHSAIPGYPADVDRILSDDGFGRNPMVETTRRSGTRTAAASAPATPSTRRSPSGTSRSPTPSTSPTRPRRRTSRTSTRSTRSTSRPTARRR